MMPIIHFPARLFRFSLFIVLLLFVASLNSSASISVGFGGTPDITLTDQVGVSSYTEHNLVIKPLGPIATETPFRMRINGGDAGGFAHNGSAYAQFALGDSFEMSHLMAFVFTPVQVDLAEYATSFSSPISIDFSGYFSGGGVVTTSFQLDGIVDGAGGADDFETWFFPASFAGIVRLESTSTLYSMDNLVVTIVPEPGTWLLMSIGAVALAFRKMTRGTRT